MYIGKTGFRSVCLLLAALAAFSCNTEEPSEAAGEATASLAITLSGQDTRSRAVAPTDEEGTEALKAAENKLHNVTVFVFNNNGTLDKKHVFSTSALTETVTGLIAGQKKIVVLANVPTSVVLPETINYAWFADPSNVIDLDTQFTAEGGLFMSGEGTATLSANQTATTTIPLSRLVAKVKLGTITVTPDPGHELQKFALNKVLIMKARGSAQMGVPSAAYTPGVLYGGMQGDKSQVKTYLSETISTSDYANRYFYVLPSDNDDENTTLVTLAGTYDGQAVYFPFRINDKVGSDGATTDGKFIRRNNVYVVNVTLKRPGSGSDNPEVPADPASLTVTVEPQEWETELIQNVEW